MNGWQLPVVGVMTNFHQASMRTSIHPLLFFNGMRFGHIMHVALQSNVHSWQKTITKIQNTWETIYPDAYFDYTFLDKTIEDLYKKDIKLSKLLACSAGIAIFIGRLGLLGLVIFMANQRTKKIGIRKVLGASVTQIIALLSKDFIALVAIAFVIAVPIAWIAMNKWLQNFAYHTALSWRIFLVSGAVMLAIALIILCIRAGRAAMANPVNSLRAE